MRKGFEALAFVCLSFTGGAAGAFAQDVDSIQVSVVRVEEDGTLVLDVDGRRMVAITDAVMRNALNAATDLRAAQAKLASTEALLAASDTAIARYETAMARQREYIDELEEVAQGYKDLLEDYKRLRGEPWLTLEGGLGATGDDAPAILVGVAVRRLRVWGFLQESNAGALVGASLPLF